ncbi:uncharacterized protein K452DRAFT_108163 [Aplosporella prunicola CBS 121167]|uniref:Uncharacterized protein n=1 Tax=Aplosporella prunicola CBS 121167 TaxID=1176127 RepID=A0A6A6BR64_9PEZI|nr:uncharacterized protein K452DRAFT_108163 [Aplosporella prunicola CBS 121167]KAF2146258.1 hypothetical protein K452DRAFT_108163 [Aplosporella prunicola CBS 121167]
MLRCCACLTFPSTPLIAAGPALLPTFPFRPTYLLLLPLSSSSSPHPLPGLLDALVLPFSFRLLSLSFIHFFCPNSIRKIGS